MNQAAHPYTPTDPFAPTYPWGPVLENAFYHRAVDMTPQPTWAVARPLLPQPHWPEQPDAIACYWKAWELCWRNLKSPVPGSGFISPFIDTAFNGCLFLWDSVFILEFARHGSRVIAAQRTLDNLYRAQHPDGFISREIDWSTGQERFHRFDPVSTGPNVFAWSEWRHWLVRGDRQRLGEVFAPILHYHRWTRTFHTWPDGSYWSCGWACGMDNQPRAAPEVHRSHHHGWLTWFDATAQALLSARTLERMAAVLGRSAEIADIAAEAARLEGVIAGLWREDLGFYVDRRPGGELSDLVSIGAYWALLATDPGPAKVAAMVAKLSDPRHFGRLHAPATLSASHPEFDPAGGYWLGAVWPPTTWMVLCALRAHGHDALAHQLALNHVGNVAKVFADTGTLWENYAPDRAAPGKPAKGDFVGWGGLGPIAVLIEEVFGLKPDGPARRLRWDLRLTGEHGIRQLPVGTALVDVAVAKRASAAEEPRITANADAPVTLEVVWAGGRRELALGGA
jgi:hypothetical protein